MEIGKKSLIAFSETLNKLLRLEKFDLIIGAGDSGQVMVWLVKEIYKVLSQKLPETIVLPVYRHADEAETILFDNNIFANDLNSRINLKNTKNILFVDDEVGSGTVVNAVANLIQSAAGDNEERELTVVAENREYQLGNSIFGIKINFVPSRNVEKGIYNAISYIVPQNLRLKIKNAIKDLVEYPNEKLALNVLLGLPIKKFNNGNPEFSDQYTDILNDRIKDFEQMRSAFENNFKSTINCLVKGEK